MVRVYLLMVYILLLMSSCESKQAKENAENINSITRGMHLNQVIDKMGQPDRVEIPPLQDSIFVFTYKSSVGMSDDYRIGILRKDSIISYVGKGQ